MFLVWSEDVAAGGPDAPLQHGLWKPEEKRLGGEGSVEVQLTSSKIFEVSIQNFLSFQQFIIGFIKVKNVTTTG